MKISELKLGMIARLVVVCCLAGVACQVAQAQSPTFQNGDVFVGSTALSSGIPTGTGKVLWYRNDGTPVATLDTGQPNTYTAGLAFDASGNLYATVFSDNNVVKFNSSGTLLGTFGGGYNAHPESMLFDSAGNAYVGQADGLRKVLKFNSAGAPLTTFAPPTEDRGTDWIELAADQKTLFYTSEGKLVKRFDLSANAQLPDFNSTALPGPNAYALRILSNGNVLVADTDRVVQLDSSGNVAQTYCARQLEVCSSPFSLEPNNTSPVLFALTLDPDGKSFWTADLVAGTVWKVDIATGAIDLTINTGSNAVGGVLVFGEPTQSKQSVTLHLDFGTASSATAFFLGPTGINDPASHGMSVTTNVTNPSGIDVVVTANYVPTELSTGMTGPGTADGICEAGSGTPNDANIDCRLAAGGFVYPYPTTPIISGDQLVPHCSPYHNNECVWYRVSTTAKAADEGGTDYIGPVNEKMGWNTNPLLGPPPPGTLSPNIKYPPGWNNQDERLYDRHGDDPSNAFQFDITDYYNVNCELKCALLPKDQSGGGHTKHFNDFVWAAPPNPPTAGTADTVELLLPQPGSSPFTYVSGLPMLVAFELEKESKEKSDPTALMKPHSVNIGTLDANGVTIPVQFPPGFPTTFTYNPFFRAYFIFLSPAPYKTDGTVYTMQIGSDLFPQPVTVKFVVKNFQF